MPLLSVLTAVHSVAASFLAEAGASALDQTLPEGWEMEWIVQEDGSASQAVHDQLPNDDRVSYAANGAHLGTAATRNFGLARLRGKYVQNLDADDLLLPGAASLIVETMEREPGLHWAFGQADDLMPDGRRISFDPWIPPFGRMPARRLTAWVDAHGGNWPIPCAGVLYRTTTIRALGGWAALPIGQDIAMLAAVSELTDGWQDETTTWLYRQHERQVSRHPSQQEWSKIARLVALQRVSSLRLTATALQSTTDDAIPIPALGESMKSAVDLQQDSPTSTVSGPTPVPAALLDRA